MVCYHPTPEVLQCQEDDKFCLNTVFPALKSVHRTPRACKHLLVASEPTGEENIWEEIPDGGLVSIDANLMLRLHEAPQPFWVTWPACVTRHPKRENVIAYAE